MNSLIFEWWWFVLFIRMCTGLYEDQIGKFEWLQQYVGKLKYAHFDGKKIVVATDENVLAALNAKTGDIIWRQILESDDNGSIKLLSVGKDIVTVSGTNTQLIRGWDIEYGYLLWEWGFVSGSEFNQWITLKQKIIQVKFFKSSHFAVTLYHTSTGKKLKSHLIPASWLVPENCVVQNDIIACYNTDKTLYCIKIQETGDEDLTIQSYHKSLINVFNEEGVGTIKVTIGKLPIIKLRTGKTEKPLLLHPQIQVIETENQYLEILGSAIIDNQDVTTTFFLENEVLHMTAKTLDGRNFNELYTTLNFTKNFGDPELGLLFCQSKKEKNTVCRWLISTSHSVLLMIQHPGKILWSREESLASILSVEMINLPVSDTDAAIEKEFDNKNSMPDIGVSSK